MFRNAANPVIRLVFFPLLLLFYLKYLGTALPILAPLFVVIFLTIMPAKPPLAILLKLLLVVVFVSFGVVSLGSVLLDSPSGYMLFCWSLLFLSFYRSHHDPKDILSTLVMLVVIIMTVITKQFEAPIDLLPLFMFQQAIIALVVTYLSFLLFPGNEKDILPDEHTDDGAHTHFALILFKATVMLLVLYVLVGIGTSQTILIAITISGMIKIPNLSDHRTFSQHRIVTTSIGILFTLPIMLMFTFGVAYWVIIGVAIFCGLQLACYAIRRGCRLSIYQMLFTNFIVLTYQIINAPDGGSFSAEFIRLVSIVIAVLIGALMLNLTMHKPVAKKKSG